MSWTPAIVSASANGRHSSRRIVAAVFVAALLASVAGSDVPCVGASTAAPQTTYFGLYRGFVVNNADPLLLMRIQVQVPDVFGTLTVWAAACVPAGATAVPVIGDGVWVSFEQGDPSYPVWMGTMVTTPRTAVGETLGPLLDLRAAPNPATSGVRLTCSLAAAAEARLTIYDVQGRLVRTVFSGHAESGAQSFWWDGRTEDGVGLPPGIYFARLEAAGASLAERITLHR